MLCKACVVALRGEILGINALEPAGSVCVRSRSQSGKHNYQCYLLGNEAHLFLGRVTYLLGLLFLAEALACPIEAHDLLDALEEILEYRNRMLSPDERYDVLLMHLADELYFWARFRDGDPRSTPDRLETLVIREAGAPVYIPVLQEIDPTAFTHLAVLRKLRRDAEHDETPAEPSRSFSGARFRGPELAELVESLELGMHCLLVGPTATGKSLCATEAFEYVTEGKPVFVIEGHESLREFDLLGGYTPDGTGSFLWNDGILVRAMRSGGFLFIDEANRMPTRTLNVLLGVLSREAVVLTEHGSEEVPAEQGFQVVMAMNLEQGYAVNALDRALLDRRWMGLWKVRGLWCNKVRNCSAFSPGKAAWLVWAREGPLLRQAKPVRLNALMALRTVWWWQPRWWAMCGAGSLGALARRIWQRRRTKASDERQPTPKCWRSASVKGRTKIGGIMPLL
jgi:hypothetical protein